MNDTESAISFAIFAAKQRDAGEVEPDHILLGCLRAISRFGIATLGSWDIDLEQFGIDWTRQPAGPRPKVAFSQEVVDLLDRAALIAKSTGESAVGVNHLLAAFAHEERGLMGELKRSHGIGNTSWRAAVAQLAFAQIDGAKANSAEIETRRVRDYLTPEQAAEELGVHVQTMRAYIRSGRMPAFRLAGERAIRILRADLEKVLEPVVGDK